MSSKPSWRDRLFGGLKGTSQRLSGNLAGIVGAGRLEAQDLDQIEDALIMSDLGPETAAQIRDKLAAERFEGGVTEYAVMQVVEREIAAILRPVAEPLEIDAFPRPQVILVIGVNGSGKTTTIAKLAHNFVEQDYGVMLAAGDTFRAAAIGQLKIWADRIGIPIISGKEGGDAAGIVYDAVKEATATGIDVLIVDTAGRLHINDDLMNELRRVNQSVKPHQIYLVIDAMTTLPHESRPATWRREKFEPHRFKPFMRGLVRVRPRGGFRLVSKAGKAYGFRVDNAYS